MNDKINTPIREYEEGYPVKIYLNTNGRYVIETLNEGGYNSTSVDLKDVVDFYKQNQQRFIL